MTPNEEQLELNLLWLEEHDYELFQLAISELK